MKSKKIFIGFLAFITLFVIPTALLFLMLTEKVSFVDMPPVGFFAIKLYLAVAYLVLAFILLFWIKG